MYVRVKTTPNSPRQSVQIVASYRVGDKVRQRIVKHIGIAKDDKELEELKSLAYFAASFLVIRCSSTILQILTLSISFLFIR